MSAALVAFMLLEEESNEKLKRRILRDRSNPLEIPEHAFIDQYRLSKDAFIVVLESVKEHLHQCSIPPVLQIAATLRFLAEENATSHLRLEADWPSILVICDEINQKDVTPKNSFAAIKKKMNSPNPHSAYYALLVLESVVKNCGAPVHEEVFTKENCEMLSAFLEQTPHENVRQKMLELVQTWAYAFRSSDKYQALKDTMNILKAKGHKFPELKEADAMFTADTAPNWADGKVCNRCRVEFTFTNRKHHCRNCGQIFCGQCTAKQCPLPKYGIEKNVRVCDGCLAQLQRPTVKTILHAGDGDLPAEYLNSSLAQQAQTPPKKTDQELKEEEELQLALALSQSEAEQKKPNQQQQLLSAAYQFQNSPASETVAFSQDFTQLQEEPNPDLDKYLNRSYWEQRKVTESPVASPSAPSPMPTPQPQTASFPHTKEEAQIDEFANNMRTQVEIFVNRMKSNSSRGRSISTDSSVQTLFMTLTQLHSQQLSYIKEMDDKRMWYEQLQDKLAQIKDSRAALDVLRQEHAEKLRHLAEEQERQRQIQMAQKLEVMRKKKQEYLQYQRQLALQRIQEQEREMQLRQEQQMAQYRMGQNTYTYKPSSAATGVISPHQQLNPNVGNVYNPYSYNPNSTSAVGGGHFNQNSSIINPSIPMPGMHTAPIPNLSDLNMLIGQNGNITTPGMLSQPVGGSTNPNQVVQHQMQSMPPPQQQTQHMTSMSAPQQQPILGHVPLLQNVIQSSATLPTSMPISSPPNVTAPATATQIEAVIAAPAPPQSEPAQNEPATAELISFD